MRWAILTISRLNMDKRGEDVDLAADVQEALCRQIFDASSYFEVLVVQVAFVRDDAKPGRWNLLLGLSCDMGEKDCIIPFYPTAQGLSETPALIRTFVGDWTA